MEPIGLESVDKKGENGTVIFDNIVEPPEEVVNQTKSESGSKNPSTLKSSMLPEAREEYPDSARLQDYSQYLSPQTPAVKDQFRTNTTYKHKQDRSYSGKTK